MFDDRVQRNVGEKKDKSTHETRVKCGTKVLVSAL